MKTYRNITVDDDNGTMAGQYSRDGGRTWHNFRARWELEWIDLAIDRGGREVAQAIWDRQDGYGEAGYTPPQGFDWSGIRDSSDDAIDAMVEIASGVVSRADFLTALGLRKEQP